MPDNSTSQLLHAVCGYVHIRGVWRCGGLHQLTTLSCFCMYCGSVLVCMDGSVYTCKLMRRYQGKIYIIRIHNYIYIRTESYGTQSYLGNRNRLPYTDLPITSNVNIMQCVEPLPGGNRLMRDVEGGLPQLLSEAHGPVDMLGVVGPMW